MATYTNADGLYLRWGQDEGAAGKAGEYSRMGPRHHVQVEIDLATLATGATVLDNFVVLPIGARLESVNVITDVAVTSGGSAVLNVGLVRTDGTTAIDIDGLVAALPIASFNAAGEQITLTQGVTYGGALLGTSLTNPAKLVADYDTAAFTAGRVAVSIFWYVPNPA